MGPTGLGQQPFVKAFEPNINALEPKSLWKTACGSPWAQGSWEELVRQILIAMVWTIAPQPHKVGDDLHRAALHAGKPQVFQRRQRPRATAATSDGEGRRGCQRKVSVARRALRCGERIDLAFLPRRCSSPGAFPLCLLCLQCCLCN